jgi:hypothetical protein
MKNLLMMAFGLSPQWEVTDCPNPEFGISTYHNAKKKLHDYYQKFYGDDGIALRLEGQQLLSVYEPIPGVRYLKDEDDVIVVNESSQLYDGISPGEFKIRPTQQRIAAITRLVNQNTKPRENHNPRCRVNAHQKSSIRSVNLD